MVFSTIAVCGYDMCKEFHVLILFESAEKRCGGQT